MKEEMAIKQNSCTYNNNYLNLNETQYSNIIHM